MLLNRVVERRNYFTSDEALMSQKELPNEKLVGYGRCFTRNLKTGRISPYYYGAWSGCGWSKLMMQTGQEKEDD